MFFVINDKSRILAFAETTACLIPLDFQASSSGRGGKGFFLSFSVIVKRLKLLKDPES
ncbi:MAG: hypothetical protein LBN01_01805 [Endomicrobium sp.]|jgi:hypothetical protein|nr:hypothetical protein [Endomicrobium sp.]